MPALNSSASYNAHQPHYQTASASQAEQQYSLVRYFIFAIFVAKIDFIGFLA